MREMDKQGMKTLLERRKGATERVGTEKQGTQDQVQVSPSDFYFFSQSPRANKVFL